MLTIILSEAPAAIEALTNSNTQSDKARNEPARIHIRVGDKGTTFKARPDTLKELDYFAKNVPQSSFEKGQTTLILPSSVNEKHLSYVLSWAHYPSPYERDSNIPIFNFVPNVPQTECYIVAHTYGIEDWANGLVTGIRSKVRVRMEWSDNEDLPELSEYGMLKSPLGQMLLQQFAWGLRKFKCRWENTKIGRRLDKDTLADVVNIMALKVDDQEPVKCGDICRWHVHEKTPKCGEGRA